MIGLNPAATVAFAFAVTFIIVANLIVYAMLGQVNARLPEGEKLSYVGFHLAKNRRITMLYKQFYPGGRLHLFERFAFAAAIACMVMVVALDR
jgi:hypothetical protein